MSTDRPDSHPYADIIHHPRPILPNHPPMSRANRAAQFAPYAALVGHQEIVASVEDHIVFDAPEIDYDASETDFEDPAEPFPDITFDDIDLYGEYPDDSPLEIL